MYPSRGMPAPYAAGMAHPFRFSVTATASIDPKAFTELARKAEDLGYSALSMADHLDEQMAPLIALTAAAGATTNLKLLSLVLANDYRHPAILAKEATSLDQVSGGRLELGIGAGWMKSDYDQAGIAYDRPSVRIARLAETAAILQAAFRGEPVHFEGEHYTIDGLLNTPTPANPDGIPLMIAGGGRKVLGVAARCAHIVGLNPGLAAGVIDERAGATATPSATDQKIAWIRESADDRFDEIELQTRVHLATISDDGPAMAAALAPALGLSPEEALASPHMLVGTEQQCVETLHRWREQWGISYIGISADALEQMAGVVAAVTGS